MQSIHKTRFRSFLQFEKDYETWTTVVVVACIVVVVVLMILLLLVLLLLLLLFGRRFKVEHDTRVHTPSMSPITHVHKTKVFSAIDFFAKIVFLNDIML